MIKRLLFLLALFVGFSLHAHAATCPISAGASSSTIVSTIQGCASGNTVTFAAGSYTLSSTVSVPCGVSITGPVVPLAVYTGGDGLNREGYTPTAIISNTAYPAFSYGSCSTARSLEYLEVNSNRPSSGGQVVYATTAGGISNLTISFNYFHGNNWNASGTYGSGPQNSVLVLFDGGSGTTADVGDTVSWNRFGANGDCATVMNNNSYSGFTGDGGYCTSVGWHTNMTNMSFDHNAIYYQEQGFKGYEGSWACLNCFIGYNDFSNIHRIDFEEQVGGGTPGTVITTNYNSIHDPVSPGNGSFGLSTASGCTNNHPSGNQCTIIDTGNVVIENVATCCGSSFNGLGIEYWSANSASTGNYNLIQGEWSNSFMVATDGSMTASNNHIQSSFGWGGSNTPANCNPYTPGSYGWWNQEDSPANTPAGTGNQCDFFDGSRQTSVTPSISPASGSFSGSQVVTFNCASCTNRDTNTGIWYTTDGSTPTPGAGTAKYSSIGGTITVTSTTTVKAVGMWGAANQPASYPTGPLGGGCSGSCPFGYGPSSAVSATYTSGGGPAATPTFSPGAGTYTTTQSVTISTTSSGAIICYNTTGAPVAGASSCTTGTLYTSPVSVASTETLYAVAGGTGFTNSTVASAAYTICSTCVSTPTVAVSGGTVTLSTPTPGAGIWYTTDGSTPTLPPGGVPSGTSSTYAPMCQPIAQPALANLKNITAFGATTGATDNTAAIESACTAAGTGVGTGIYIPAGIFHHTGQLSLNCNIYGQGPTSELYCPSPTTGGTNCEMITAGSSLVWSNFSHQMPFTTRDAQNWNIYMNGGTGNRLDTLLLVGGNAGGILNTGTTNEIDTNNGIFNTGADCNFHGYGTVTNDTVDHEYMYNCGDDSISNVMPVGDGNVTGTLMQWNSLNQGLNARGISVAGGNNVTIQNNYIAGMHEAGIYVSNESGFNSSSNVIARYNYLFGDDTIPGGGNNEAAIWLWGSSNTTSIGTPGVTNILALGNYIANTSTNAFQNIGTYQSSPGIINDVSFTNNTITGTVPAWGNTGTSTNVQCTGNTYNGATSSGGACGGTNPATATGSPVTYSGCVVGTAQQYTGPFTVSGALTIKAVAVFPGLTNSTVGTGSTGAAAAAPTFSPASGTNFTGTQAVTLSDSTSGSTIFYYTSSPAIATITTFGPTFTDSSGNVWSLVNTSGGQMAINGQTVSVTNNVVEMVYVNGNVWQVNTTGNWYEVTSVTGTPPTQTVNFGSPTTTSPIPSYSTYTTPISLTASSSITAYATAPGFSNSPVVTATYGLQAATPVFSPPSESFSGTLAVSITDSTPGAAIYYCTTTTSCTPTTSSTLYTGAITVSATTIINAIGVAMNYVNSAVGNGTYTLIPPPTLTGGFQNNAGNVNTLQVGAAAVQQVANGTYSDGLTRTLPDGFGNTAVWSSQNSAILQVTSTGLISCLASSAGATVNSLVSSAPGGVVFNAWGWTCTPGTVAATPTFSPAGETFSGTIGVTASSTTPSATLFCTIDGSTPTTSSPVYTGAFSVSTTTTIKCIATASGFTQSAVGTSTYTQATVATPVFTPPTESFTGTISVAAASSTPSTTLHCTTNGTTPTTGSPTYAGPFSVSTTTTIQCLGVAAGYINSAVGSGTYTLSSTALTSCSMTASPSVTTLTTGGATTQMIGQCFYASTSQTLACSPGADANGNQITAWGSSNTGVLNVGLIGSGSPGVASGVTAGSANATATATGGRICTPYSFTVAGPTLTGVSAALQSPPGGTTVTIGTPVQACATFSYTGVSSTQACGAVPDLYGTIPTLWTSSSAAQALVSSSGVVSGVAAGSANLGVSAGATTSGLATQNATLGVTSAPGWKPVCILTACNPGGTNAPASTSQTNNTATPSLTGASMQFSETTLSSATTQTNALWVYLAGACDTCTSFNSDFWVYLAGNIGTNNNLEWDMFDFDVTDNLDLMWGSQCNLTTGTWQYSDATHGWANTGVACALSTGVWHHLQYGNHRSGSTENFDTLTVDGVTHVLGLTLTAGTLPGGYASAVGYQTQLDIGAATSATTATEYQDKAMFWAAKTGFTSSPLGLTIQAPTTNVTLSLDGVVLQGVVTQ